MPKRNPFWYFMREMMDELRNGGVEIDSFAEMPSHAGPKWSAMSADERRPYEEMVHRSEPPADFDDTETTGRRNNHRELISEHERQELDKKYRKLAREKEVVSLRRFWPPGNEVIEEKFLLIYFEYFVKTREDVYLPCEVALVEFSMQEGIMRKFHSYVDPGPCPRGYMYEERLRSEQRHQIPCCERFNISQFTNDQRVAFKNHKKILQDVVDFCTRRGTVANPRAFTFGDDLEMVVSCLDYLYDKAKDGVNFEKTDLPRILPLEHLLPQFYFHSSRVAGSPPSINSMQRVLTQSVWDYESGIRCSFHEEVETRFCALGQVHRWCFAIFDAMKMPIVDEDLRQDVKAMNNARPVFDFVLTDRHLPAPSKSNFTLMKTADLIDVEYRKSISSAVKPRSGSSTASSVVNGAASSVRPFPHPASSVRPRSPVASEASGASSVSHDVRESYRRDALKFDENSNVVEKENASSSAIKSSSSSTPTAVASPTPTEPKPSSIPSAPFIAANEKEAMSPARPLDTKVNYLGRGFGIKSRVADVGASAAAAAAAAFDTSTDVKSFGRGRGCVKRSTY